MEPSNILKIESLSEKWSDKDNVMLHACFQILKDCIEKEGLIEKTNWEQDKNYKNAKLDIEELYNWWTDRLKLEKEEKIDPIWDKNQYEIDNQKLIKLIKVRMYLWT